MSSTILDDIRHRPIYSLKRVPSLVTDKAFRHSVGRRLNQVWHTKNSTYQYNKDGVDIFEEDWDNLVILDSCRFDYFKEAKQTHNLPGRLEHRTSRGSQTPEWLKANFDGKTLHDTVYVSASVIPYHVGVENFQDGTPFQQKYSFKLDVHDLVNLWEDPPTEAIEVYNESRIADYVIPADVTANRAIKIQENYPNKRMIIHIVPPHLPYLGPTGEDIHKESATPWMDTYNGKHSFSYETLEQAYHENVDHAVSAAKQLISELVGKTVVTADHGEFLFDRSSPLPVMEYLHPAQTYVDELVKIPWLIVDSNERKSIEPDPPKNISGTDQSDSHKQLEALGYL